MTGGLVWLVDAAGFALVLVIGYGLTRYFATQIRLTRRIKLATGERGSARQAVSLTESTMNLRSVLKASMITVGRFMPLNSDDRTKIALALQRAGFRASGGLAVMLGTKFSCLVGGLLSGIIGAVIYIPGPFAWPIGLVGGTLAGVVLNIFPELVVRRLGGKRMWRIDTDLPDAFDLMVICLESGLTFDRALQRTVDNLESLHPDLAQEFGRVALDLNVHGSSRGDALGQLAERLDSQNFRDLAITVNQSERHGTPLADALRRLASSMRVQAVARVQERMGRLPTLLVVPSIAGILPGILMIVGGPAFQKLTEEVGRFAGG